MASWLFGVFGFLDFLFWFPAFWSFTLWLFIFSSPQMFFLGVFLVLAVYGGALWDAVRGAL